jgi:hypothetical protein
VGIRPKIKESDSYQIIPAMQPQRFYHTIRFRGSAHPQGRYQLQISESKPNGQLQYRAQWDFPTLRSVMVFLGKYFPHSQALNSFNSLALTFDQVVSVIRSDEFAIA